VKLARETQPRLIDRSVASRSQVAAVREYAFEFVRKYGEAPAGITGDFTSLEAFRAL
jgi:hypothetical protein